MATNPGTDDVWSKATSDGDRSIETRTPVLSATAVAPAYSNSAWTGTFSARAIAASS